jgi:ABC-type sugar transport system substrate-binding protein
MMELKHSIALIHISATHTSSERRKKAIAEYLIMHPDIDTEEVLSMMPEMHIDEGCLGSVK